MFNFKPTPIGISCTFDANDPRLNEKVDIHVQYAGSGILKNKVCHKTVSVTEAEKAVIESIAMRLFMEHKRFIKTYDVPNKDKVMLRGVIAIDIDK